MTVFLEDAMNTFVYDIVTDVSREESVFILHIQGVSRMDISNYSVESIKSWPNTWMYV